MCNCCRVPRVDVTSITIAASTVSLNTGPFEGCLDCSGRFNLCIPFNFSNADAGKTVQIVDATGTYPCETRNGNNLRLWQIIAKKKCGAKYLHLRLLNDPVHVQVLDCMPEGCNNTVDPIIAQPTEVITFQNASVETAATAKAGK